MRRPDKPGQWTVRPRGARFLLSGVTTDGQRVKLYATSETDAKQRGNAIFGTPFPSGIPEITESIGPIPAGNSTGPPPLDDWGFPIRVSPEVASTVAASFGIKPGPSTAGPVPPPPLSDNEEKLKRDRRAKNAKSIMEMAGMGYAAGTVMVANKWVKAGGKDPVKVNPRQVNDLADASKETFTEWFGDRDVKPWQMMFLLTIGIPLSMWLQSPKTKDTQEKPRTLQSVP